MGSHQLRSRETGGASSQQLKGTVTLWEAATGTELQLFARSLRRSGNTAAAPGSRQHNTLNYKSQNA
jgi:hypothetical protein